MSDLLTIARPYAKAAFVFSKEHKSLKQWSEMLQLITLVTKDDAIQPILNSPRLTHTEIAQCVIDVCAKNIDKEFQNFIKLLSENHRLSLLPQITLLFDSYHSQEENRISAEIVSAKKLSSAEIKPIKDALKRRLGVDIEIVEEIDEKLLGGAIVRAGDLVIDGSIRSKLNKLLTELS